jgi:streptogramin lyase
MSVKRPRRSSEPAATSVSQGGTDQSRSSRYLARITLALLVGMLAGVALGQNITEFPIPTAGSEPFGITAGPDGALWFTDIGGVFSDN